MTFLTVDGFSRFLLFVIKFPAVEKTHSEGTDDDGMPKYFLDKFDSFGKVISRISHHSKGSTFSLIDICGISKYKFNSLTIYIFKK